MPLNWLILLLAIIHLTSGYQKGGHVSHGLNWICLWQKPLWHIDFHEEGIYSREIGFPVLFFLHRYSSTHCFVEYVFRCCPQQPQQFGP